MAQKPIAPIGILPHRQFKEAIPHADFASYKADPRMRVANPEAFKEMQAHVQALYDGIDAAHSFTDDAGQVFDCVPIGQQPSLKHKPAAAAAVPRAPDLSELSQNRTARPAAPQTSGQLKPDRNDRHGNSMSCPPGTIPMRRITLDELGRFANLQEYLRKSPRKRRPEQFARPSSASDGHLYAYTQQDVDNIGAHNFLALWSPQVNSDQVFSLSQHWYAGGSGSGHQTAEVGWQVYPAKYGHSQPALFVYWTADDYVNTGAYNLDGPGFVQTNSGWALGGALSPVSTAGGAQYEIEVMVYLYQGNWWLYLGGTSGDNAIGYWPTSIYNGGQMASHAQQILFGGETVTDTGPWPPMGSGAFASSGWTQAAYQRDIYYFPPNGGWQWANLTPAQPTPADYTTVLSSAADPWNIYFFYGGPGGTG